MSKIYLSYAIAACIMTFSASNIIINEKEIHFLFSHGIADTHRQAFKYTHDTQNPAKSYIIPSRRLLTFDYPDATLSKLRVNRHEVCLAQDKEVIHLAHHFYHKIDPASHTILVGVSRGASALVTFIDWYNPQSVCALILESPFDSVDSVVRNMIHRSGLSWIPGSHHAGLALLCSIFKKYDANGIKPVESAKRITDQIPILLICSLQDMLVPAWSTMTLYAALRSTGNRHVYLLIIPEGSHAKLIEHPTAGPLYQRTAHAFYRLYGLPHDPCLAKEGESVLNDCQPSNKALLSYIPDYALSWFNQWQ